MIDLGKFLGDLGLSRYLQTLRDNDIDGDALAHLEESHLRELGFSLGHRVRLLKALEALRAGSIPARIEQAPTPSHDRAPQHADATAASPGERRQMTLMFCDLVGSTELSARVDPEEMREFMRSYQDVCAAAIARFDGYLAKFMGDGVLAYFGYPRAHEDAAERAVRAGRAIVEAVRALRIGIATGLVVVGRIEAADGGAELAVTGETPNLAARLQALAEPNSVVIGEQTRTLTRGAFRYADLGLQRLKGLRAPVRAWRVEGEAATSRFEAAHSGGLGKFVGREQEVALLLSRWEQAAYGEGQVVLLCGEAGIGKSRIAEQLRQRLQDADHTRIRHQCSPFHVNSALQPAIAQLEFAADIRGEDDGPTRLTKLEALLRPTTPNLDVTVPLVASLLGIPLDGRYAAPRIAADLAKRRTLEALAAQIVALSAQRPVYWLVEDAHWMDPSTRDLIGQTLDRIRDARVFALITFRPEFAPPWMHLPHVTALTLNRLARRQCVDLVANLCGARDLPAEILESIITKSDGIPLFVEELTKTVLESGLLSEGEGRYELSGPLPPMAVPASLQDSLMARLDRLSPVREVAQIGSVIGREFSYDLLASVAPMGANELADALAQLARAGLVYARGEPPEATYVFKHALVQDAAYASLLRSRRQQLHARIAEILERKAPDTPSRRPELLAFHFGAAGLDAQAKEYWSRAARQAFARNDFAEALHHNREALSLVRKEPPSPARTRTESELLDDQVVLLAALKGPGSAEAGRAALEAIEVSAPLGDDPLHVRALWMDWMHHGLAGKLTEASVRAERLVRIADRVGDVDLKLQAHHARWTTSFFRGEVGTARVDIEEGLRLYDFERHKGHWALYGGHDPGICARGTGGCTLWLAGEPQRGARVIEDALRIGQELQHPFSYGVGLIYGGFFAIMSGDAEAAAARAALCAEIAAEAKLALPAAMARVAAAWARARSGELGRGTEELEAAFRDWLNARQRGYLTFIGTLIAEAKLDMGRIEEALNLLDETEQLASESFQHLFLSELHRLRAEALLRLDPRGERVEAEFRAALDVARRQGTPALELRAATGFAKWLGAAGRASEGLDVLRPAHGRFTEGFETRDLAAAKAAIDALA
jgi:class 3 adenylate cyclase/predicted ATPase